jgi:hypothetical protein
VPPEEDVVALVVERYYLAALEVGLRGPEGLEEVRCEEAERGAEIV